MTPDEVRAIVREEIETYAAAAFEALAPAFGEVLDIFACDVPIVGPLFQGLANLFRPGDADAA